MLSITVDDSAFRSYLAELNDRLTDMAPAMAGIGQELESRVSARFETQTGPGGPPWAPWAASTSTNYPKDGNHRILDRYGDMLASLNWSSDASSATIGFGQHYATYHEWGTRRMPRRGLLFADPDAGALAPEDEQHVIAVLERWLEAD